MNAVMKFVLFMGACFFGAVAMAVGLNIGSDIYMARLRPHVQNRLQPKPEASEGKITG